MAEQEQITRHELAGALAAVTGTQMDPALLQRISLEETAPLEIA